MRDSCLRAVLATLALLGIGGFLGGCCRKGPCLDVRSTKDKQRVGAVRARLGKVLNDSVSAPDRDRTDWKYIILPTPGKLTVQLHWDRGNSKLELAVYDLMGIKIQEGRVWGIGGLRAVVAIEEPGRYYIMVRARSYKDESHYALRLLFKKDRPKVTKICLGCTPGARRCLGPTAFLTCEQVGPNCTTWAKQTPCPPAIECKDGQCGDCTVTCSDGERQCAGAKSFKVCKQVEGGGCPVWSDEEACPKGKRCRNGKCVGRGRTPPTKVQPRPQPQPKTSALRCKIISIYKYRGRMTLHLECGDKASALKPGMLGKVLEWNTGKPLPGGEIKLTKVVGRYAIATTTLIKLGKNRWVQIYPR